MTVSGVYTSNLLLRIAVKTLAFLCALSVTVFSASAGYGLLRMLIDGMRSGADIGAATFVTHGGLTAACFAAAGLGAWAAKRCFS